MSTINIPDRVLKIYVSNIKRFESNIKIYNNKNIKHQGYLINLNDYKDLKTKIKYENNKSIGIPNILEIDDKNKILFIKDLEFKTNQYLINMILNGHKYIIVDNNIWKTFCEKGKEKLEPYIDYEIDNINNVLSLTIKGQKTALKFDNIKKDNILEESKLKNKSSSNFEEIKKEYINLKNYYDFKVNIEKDLKNKKEEKNNYKGYLIEKEWIDKWKQQIEYDIIKKDYLISKKSEKETRDKLIYIYEKKKLNYMDIN